MSNPTSEPKVVQLLCTTDIIKQRHAVIECMTNTPMTAIEAKVAELIKGATLLSYEVIPDRGSMH